MDQESQRFCLAMQVGSSMSIQAEFSRGNRVYVSGSGERWDWNYGSEIISYRRC